MELQSEFFQAIPLGDGNYTSARDEMKGYLTSA